MRNKTSEDWAIAYDALDRFWQSSDDAYQIGDEQVLFMESVGANPIAMAEFTRLMLGNCHDPIDDPVAAAIALKINVGAMPERVQEKIPACAAWFHDTPTLLVAERSNLPQYRHAVATEIGGLLVARTASKSTRQHNKRARDFADAFLYPDTAIRELKHAPSRHRYISHSEDFGVPRATILRRLLTVNKRPS